MKTILFILLLLPFVSAAQKNKANEAEPVLPIVNGKVFYSEVITIDSASSTDLFQRAKKFFVTAYKSAKDVIQLEDEKNGEITGKGIFKVFFNMGIAGGETTSIKHTISIYVKEGKYKYEIKNFEISFPGSLGASLEGFAKSKMKMHKRLINDVDAEIRATIDELKMAMKEISEVKKDW